jgi:hypothetical protein
LENLLIKDAFLLDDLLAMLNESKWMSVKKMSDKDIEDMQIQTKNNKTCAHSKSRNEHHHESFNAIHERMNE